MFGERSYSSICLEVFVVLSSILHKFFQLSGNFAAIKVTRPKCPYLKCRTCYNLLMNSGDAYWLEDYLGWRHNFSAENDPDYDPSLNEAVTLENVCGAENQGEYF